MLAARETVNAKFMTDERKRKIKSIVDDYVKVYASASGGAKGSTKPPAR